MQRPRQPARRGRARITPMMRAEWQAQVSGLNGLHEREEELVAAGARPIGPPYIEPRSEVLSDAPRETGGLSANEQARFAHARRRALHAAEVALDLHYRSFRAEQSRAERSEAPPAAVRASDPPLLHFTEVFSDGVHCLTCCLELFRSVIVLLSGHVALLL